MSRDYWMTRRKTPVIDKLKQTITLQAGTWNCGPEQGANYISGRNKYRASVSSYDLTNAHCTIECWFKFAALPASYSSCPLISIQTNGPTEDDEILVFKLAYSQTIQQFIITVADIHSTTVTFNTGVSALSNQWHHYAVTRSYSAGTTTIKFYVDGVLAYTGTANSLTNNNIVPPYNLFVGTLSVLTGYISGWLSNLRLWNSERKEDEIFHYYKRPLGAANTDNANLIHSFLMCYEENVYYVESIGNQNQFANSYTNLNGASPVNLVKEKIPGYGFGASFVVAEWDVTLPNKVSLEWPATPPSGTTGALYVRWIDSNGDTQRRILWTLTGVDVEPPVATYAGENLGTSFTLEFWNVDGAATAILPTNYVLGISSCTNPTTSYDKTHQSALTVTADSTLAEGFPLTPFPLQFNEQQTY